ncbi:hypothetical protein B4119_4297 [Parageobacillus caldoxylosilyticus]|uniref:Uncharacterized protein n=1 Tax=Saccharococcus caldoxylosilyticus TaxID=81408 RepID=A0A150L6T5_9BACL|nr:hypothetical protein B4119_4297 [Parageobacillus caldoxylosilyticus]
MKHVTPFLLINIRRLHLKTLQQIPKKEKPSLIHQKKRKNYFFFAENTDKTLIYYPMKKE